MITNKKLIPATFDPVFKEVFTSKDCHNFTCRMISKITGIDEEYLKKHLKVINSNLEKKKAYEKTKITDVLLSVEGHIINLEMNKNYYPGLFEKNDVYQHSLISSSIRSGESYQNLKKVIQINIDNFSKFKKAISVFKLMEMNTHEIENENYIKFHISLSKIQNKYYNKEELSYLEKQLFMMTIEDKELLDKISIGDEVLMELRKKVEVLSDEEIFTNLYDIERQEKMIYNSKMQYAEETGMKKGLEKGMKQGIEQGMKKDKEQIAKKMLEEGFTKEIILKCTGIKEEDFTKLEK